MINQPAKSIDAVAFAKWLGVSRMTIHRMRTANELPPTIPTKRRFVRWLARDVELWLSLDCPGESEFRVLKRTQKLISGGRR